MNQLKSETSSSIEAHLAALYGRINYERQTVVMPRHFKLQNMREFLRRLGDPHLHCPVIHVAGTKGKGSVSTMIARILTSAGRNTGLYTSPHLEKINQRMVVDGQMITDEQLVDTLSTLQPAVQAMDEEAKQVGHRPLTFFEITTAAAFLFFAKQNCDVVVLETGLGGRLDSTNVCQPVTCVITNISLDHTRQLGATVDKIAYEKAGIIKPGVPIVSGAIDPDAADVIAEVAQQQNAPLLVLDRDFRFQLNPQAADPPRVTGATKSTEPNPNPVSNFVFSVEGRLGFPPAAAKTFEVADLELNMLGHHQRTNAAVTVAAIQTLNAVDFPGEPISDASIRSGLRTASLSGRTEIVRHNPTVVLDMAHNVASIEALVESLRSDLPQWNTSNKRWLILATSRDKDAPGMLRPLVEHFDEIILTRYQDNPRGKSEKELLKIAKTIQSKLKSQSQPFANLSTQPNPVAAWKYVQSNFVSKPEQRTNVQSPSGPEELVCITGSAFLVAEMRPALLEHRCPSPAINCGKQEPVTENAAH